MKYSCYYIICFGCLWALINTFILLLGLTYWPRAQCQFLFFLLFQCFEEKEYQTESKRNETFGRVIFGTSVIEGTWSRREERSKEATRQGGAPAPLGAPPTLVGPTDLLLPPIYIHIPRKHPGAPRNPISTAATFYTREIPSWSLFRCCTGGGIDHGGLLHQHHSLSDELWVVYFRHSGP